MRKNILNSIWMIHKKVEELKWNWIREKLVKRVLNWTAGDRMKLFSFDAVNKKDPERSGTFKKAKEFWIMGKKFLMWVIHLWCRISRGSDDVWI